MNITNLTTTRDVTLIYINTLIYFFKIMHIFLTTDDQGFRSNIILYKLTTNGSICRTLKIVFLPHIYTWPLGLLTYIATVPDLQVIFVNLDFPYYLLFLKITTRVTLMFYVTNNQSLLICFNGWKWTKTFVAKDNHIFDKIFNLSLYMLDCGLNFGFEWSMDPSP